MKNKKTNAEQVWKQLDDLVVPRLLLSVIDRAVYSHLLRHSRLEGILHLRFSIPWLAKGIRLSGGATRESVRRLVARGPLLMLERSCKASHVVFVRLPAEIPGARPRKIPARRPARSARPVNLEKMDFLQTRALRRAIHSRERGSCFYCLRTIPLRIRCLDHVVPRALLGRNSYRNLVSCCSQCNLRKGDRPAADFLRRLYRERCLTGPELVGRLRALDALASGKLRPSLVASANPLPR